METLESLLARGVGLDDALAFISRQAIANGASADEAAAIVAQAASTAPQVTQAGGFVGAAGGIAPQPGSPGPQGPPAPTFDVTGGGLEDSIYNLDNAELEAAAQRRLAQYTADFAQNETTYGQLEQEANARLPRELEQSRNTAGARGMLHAGGFLEQQSDIQRDVADYRSRLLNDKMTGANNLARGRDEDLGGFQEQRRRALQSAAERQAARAAKAAADKAEYDRNKPLPPGTVPGTPSSGQQPGAITGPTPNNPTGATPLGNGQNPANVGGGLDREPVATISRPTPTPATPAPTSTNYGNGTNPALASGGAGLPKVTPKASPQNPVTQVGKTANSARSVSSFDPKSQRALSNGAVVVGGDGRKFKLVNGVAAYIGM